MKVKHIQTTTMAMSLAALLLASCNQTAGMSDQVYIADSSNANIASIKPEDLPDCGNNPAPSIKSKEEARDFMLSLSGEVMGDPLLASLMGSVIPPSGLPVPGARNAAPQTSVFDAVNELISKFEAISENEGKGELKVNYTNLHSLVPNSMEEEYGLTVEDSVKVDVPVFYVSYKSDDGENIATEFNVKGSTYVDVKSFLNENKDIFTSILESSEVEDADSLLNNPLLVGAKVNAAAAGHANMKESGVLNADAAYKASAGASINTPSYSFKLVVTVDESIKGEIDFKENGEDLESIFFDRIKGNVTVTMYDNSNNKIYSVSYSAKDLYDLIKELQEDPSFF